MRDAATEVACITNVVEQLYSVDLLTRSPDMDTKDLRLAVQHLSDAVTSLLHLVEAST